MNSITMEQDLQQFKSEMMMYRPFFGDILLRLPILRDDSVRTACTDGRTIRWNGSFFSSLSSSQRHYVLMHEVLHTLLMHPSRMQEQDHEVWNIAADMIVNQLCDQIARDINKLTPGTLMERPKDGIFVQIPQNITLESLYGMIAADYRKSGKKRFIKNDYRPGMHARASEIEVTPDLDLLPGGPGGRMLTRAEQKELEEQIKALLRSAGGKGRSAIGSYYVPRELVQLIKPKPISWRTMLREHLTQVTGDEASYATPERKYLHMDMILPGYSLTEDGELESLWAFVDSSGSIGGEELNQFLTQLHRIVREFRCELNLCYWDTQVTDVYRKIRNEKHVLDCQPNHSGGTDINCVYRWMKENHVRPDVMLILTDGYFGAIEEDTRPLLRPRDTILAISNESTDSIYSRIGKVCRLV